jgi:hypothetical protein
MGFAVNTPNDLSKEDYSAAGKAAAGIDPNFNPATALYPVSTTGGGGTGGGTQTAAPGPSAEDLYWNQRREYEAQARQAAQDSVITAVSGMFNQYGLGSLYSKVVEYARSGYSGDAIAVMLRSTPEYKARFPAMDALATKGRAISEQAYIDYERTAGALEQRYGFPQGMVMESVTDLLTNEVSAAELNDRMQLASADSLNAPQDLKDTLSDYYNLDPEMALRAYYLDPDKALPILEKQSASARIGAWARRQGVTGIDVTQAEDLQGFGVTEQEAQAGFGKVKAQEGLSAGKGDVASKADLVAGNLKGTAAARDNIERAASSRVGRFQGGGGFVDSQKGVSGLGSS